MHFLSRCCTERTLQLRTPSSGSAVKHLAVRDATDAELQAVLMDYPGVCSLNLTIDCTRLSAAAFASLIHLPHIRNLAVNIFDISSLKSLHTLTHLERLTIHYGIVLDKEGAPHIPCADFFKLTSLKGRDRVAGAPHYLSRSYTAADIAALILEHSSPKW